MTPEQKLAVALQVGKAEETRLNAHVRVEQEHVVTLRQVIEKIMSMAIALDREETL